MIVETFGNCICSVTVIGFVEFTNLIAAMSSRLTAFSFVLNSKVLLSFESIGKVLVVVVEVVEEAVVVLFVLAVMISVF